MHETDMSGVKVAVLGVHDHHWVTGDRFYHDPREYQSEHFSYQLWLVKSGCVRVRMNESEWAVRKGSVCVFPVNLERTVYTSCHTTWLSIGLRVTVFNKFSLFRNVNLPTQWTITEEEQQLMESWMTQIITNKKSTESHKKLMMNGMAQTILGFCWPHLSSLSLASSVHHALPEWLGKILKRISMDPSCSISALAHDAGFSPAQFRRVFHQHVGSTPRDYLAMKRMESACHYLEQTTLTLGAISAKVGLRDVPYFSRVFKSAYGVTPSVYRASLMENSATEMK